MDEAPQDPLELPLSDEDIEDLLKMTTRWYQHRWGSPMDPAMCRGLAKDTARLVHQYKKVAEERDKLRGDYQSWSELCDDKDKQISDLKEQLEAAFATGTNTKEEFENNPCTICGAAPGVHCPHD